MRLASPPSLPNLRRDTRPQCPRRLERNARSSQPAAQRLQTCEFPGAVCALGKVSQQELEWAQGEVSRVLERLRRLSDELSHLAALKAALETGH